MSCLRAGSHSVYNVPPCIFSKYLINNDFLSQEINAPYIDPSPRIGTSPFPLFNCIKILQHTVEESTSQVQAMGYCVFMLRPDSIYDDSPAERYQFPRQYLGRAETSVGDWIVYLEPTKLRHSRGYFAIARVREIIPDPTIQNMFLALIEPGSYLDFSETVPFSDHGDPIERCAFYLYQLWSDSNVDFFGINGYASLAYYAQLRKQLTSLRSQSKGQ